MPELPDRPDSHQLRRQARDLHRAAAAGRPDAVTRIRAVSDQVALFAAQLAIAREYGYPSWPALLSAVRRRRAQLPAEAPRPEAGNAEYSADWPAERYSFGGGDPIDAAAGTLSPSLLTAGADGAELRCSAVFRPELTTRAAEHDFRPQTRPAIDDLTATDDRGVTYTFALGWSGSHGPRTGNAPRHGSVGIRIEPVPPAGTSWIELRSASGSATRLTRSPRATVRIAAVATLPPEVVVRGQLDRLAYGLLARAGESGDLGRQRAATLAILAELAESGQLTGVAELAGQLTRLCDSPAGERPPGKLPDHWHRFRDAVGAADGQPRQLDLAAAFPSIAGTEVRLDHLESRSRSWLLHLRAGPGWWGYSEDGHRKWSILTVSAEDDRGGRYLSGFAGSSGKQGCEALALEFVPRIDPLGRRLTLTFAADGVQAAAELDLASGP